MSAWLIGLVTFVYVCTAAALWYEGRGGLAVVFAGYALANVGLIYDVVSGWK